MEVSRMKVYDIVIIGGGPAGLAAGLYAGRAKMDTLIIEKQKFGGQIVITDEIENYPGSIEGETGPSLMARMVAQADKFGCERVEDTITDVELEGEVKIIKGNKGEYQAKAVIITGGEMHKNIGCPGEKELTGKGVSYCATCDAAFFEDFEVYVVGGGDAAVEEAMYLTRFARKVTLIHRRDELRAARSIQEKAFANPKMDFMWNTTIEEIKGDGLVESMIVKDTKTGETREIFADEEDGTFGIFVFIGYTPTSQIYEGKVDMERGYILTDEEMRTNIPGVFAAGDIRKKTLKQVVTAVADGAIAAVQASEYIEEKAGTSYSGGARI
jgi:thioredoxin reductase (NADPH)